MTMHVIDELVGHREWLAAEREAVRCRKRQTTTATIRNAQSFY